MHSDRSPVSIDSGRHRERAIRIRNELVESHLSLAEGIARNVARSLPPSFDVEDLIATGNMALMQAATSYRPKEHGGAPFSAYARQRIRGAILESIRRRFYTEQTRPGLERTVSNDSGEAAVVPIDALNRVATPPDAERAIARGEVARRVEDAVSWLPARHQRLLTLYYAPNEPTLADVAAQMGMGKRTAQKIHRQAIRALKVRLRGGAYPRAA